MELAEAAKSDDDLSVIQSTKALDHGPYIGSSIDGLRLETILEPDLSSEEPPYEIDVVHVLGAAGEQGIISLSTLKDSLPADVRKREFRFEVDMSALLCEDAKFITHYIDAKARQLLSGLRHFCRFGDRAVRRAIIATAYDVGAVVLKQAISIASKDEYECAEIFTSIARIVLVGCFQRGDEHQLGMKHLSFLNDTGKDSEWRTLITLASVQTLVSATSLANTAFLDSKISLRSRIFSLYAGASGGRIHLSLDYATATIGLSTELAMQEQDHKSEPNDSFPLLAKNIGRSINNCRIADLSAIALEQTILSLVPPNVQMRSKVPLPDHLVLSSTAYQSWSHLNGIQILYLDGPDTKAATVAAEQISMDWARRQQESDSYYCSFFQFRFDATDPTSNSMASMIAASVLHYLREAPLLSNRHHNMLQDQYKLQNAWTDDDLLSLWLYGRSGMLGTTPHVFYGIDECNVRSRKKFWARLGEIASKCEDPVKIVVTANNPEIYTSETLRNELKGWPEVALLVYEASHVVAVEVESENDMQNALIAHLCPIQLGEERIRRTLQRLESMDHKTMASVLHVAETYSRWPIQRSHDNFSLFLEIFENMTPSSTPREVVWRILRSIQEQEWLACVLMWMIYGQRPLTPMELARIVSFQIKGQDESMTPPDDHDVQQCLADIGSRVRGLASLSSGKLCIRPDILKLMTDEAGEYWVRIKEQAPRRTAEFLLEYLKLPSSQELLKVLYKNYQKRVQRSGNSITPPMTPDGREIIFYAVQALPHHLSKIETTGSIKEQMKDLSGPYVQWAKAYWAMSNPFSRPPKGPLRSAWSTWETSYEFERPKLEMAHRIDVLKGESAPVESLIKAVRDNDEALALIFANDIVSDFSNRNESTEDIIKFPPSVLWRATWLGMDRLLDFLLRQGRQQDDTSSSWCPSMLYLASNMGNLKIVDILLSYKVDVRAKSNSGSTPIITACVHGHLEVVKTLLEEDPTLLDWPQPHTPLYAAASWGFWKCVELLLEKGADPNRPRTSETSGDDLPNYDWTPISISCSEGYVKTVQKLLEHKADPNTAGPSGTDTCLWFAAMHCGSLEIMKMLLEHGADPNHELLKPPLLSEIIQNVKISEITKIKMFDLLIDNDPPVDLERGDQYGVTPLMVAGEAGNLSAVQWLLNRTASINTLDSQNRSVLFHAILNKKWNVVHYLLAHHEQPRLDLLASSGQTLLELTMDHIDELKALLDAGADPGFENYNKHTLLNSAVVAQNEEVVGLLLEPARHIDVHHRDYADWSPIMNATGYTPNAQIARLLLEAGARLSDTTEDGLSPLHLAAFMDRPDVLQVLLNFHQADDLVRCDNNGQTALLEISDFTRTENFECIRLLVRAGADINAQASDGETVLIQSARFGANATAVHDWLLAQPKIDIHVRAQEGTALHIACRYGNIDLVKKLLQNGADANANHASYGSTPLIAACIPRSLDDSENVSSIMENAEQIVRALVANGADAGSTCGICIFNAVCAAAFCTETGIINFLLDKASVQAPDPLGRLPIHFAAANGIRMFETVALAHGENIMIPDNFNKTALHWAAQMGKAETTKLILQKLSPKDKETYVNLRDSDGWTPLAWASRLSLGYFAPFWTRFESQNYEATIQCLIENGADISVRFLWGHGEGAEELTPLKMARRCKADKAIIQLLNSGNALGEEAKYEPIYKTTSGFCDFCFAQTRGHRYNCVTCGPINYSICSKCYSTATVEHPRTATFGGPHTLCLAEGYEQEFETPSEPIVEDEAVANSDVDGAEDSSAELKSKESTPDLDETSFHANYIEQLDLPDLNDLGNLDDL